VDTEGFVLKVEVHSAKVMDYEGIKTLLDRAKGLFPRLAHLWMDAGYRGEAKGADWVEKTLGWGARSSAGRARLLPRKCLGRGLRSSGPKKACRRGP
jgi:hypothetical protein